MDDEKGRYSRFRVGEAVCPDELCDGTLRMGELQIRPEGISYTYECVTCGAMYYRAGRDDLKGL